MKTPHKLTDEQLLAMQESTKDILVSAAAGSGKTSVLSDRILYKILNDNVNIDEILVVTFTNSAASEMKERIIKKINNAIKKNPQNNFLKEQLTRINKAKISTIDSFFYSIVKNNFKVLNIDPNFKIDNDAETKLLRQQSIENFLEDLYKKNNPSFIQTIDAFTKKANDENFIEILLKVHENSQNIINPYKALEDAYKQFNMTTKGDYFNSGVFKQIISYSKSCLEEVILILEKINYMIDVEKFDDEIKKTELKEFFIKESEIYNTLLKNIESENYDAFLEGIKSFKLGKFPSAKFPKNNPEFKDKVKILRDSAKALITNTNSKGLKEKFFIKSVDHVLDDSKKAYGIMKSFCELIIEFDKYYLQVKKDKKIYSSSDISHFCLDILVKDGQPTDIAKQYQQCFKEIIIDEYQDSSPIQETILAMISNNNRFMVGDIKQCIYRFRQADPKIFKEKYDKYVIKEDISNRRIDLNTNFRSSKSVIDSINIIFESIMNDNLGGINYDKSSKLYFSNNDGFNNHKCELTIIDALSEIDEEEVELMGLSEELLYLQKEEIEAHYVAQRIKELVEYENFNYGDIAIIMRTKKNIDVFNKILDEYSIPCYSNLKNGFYDFIEIQNIINILKILDNPMQDLPLIGVMYSSIFNFNANELLEIKLLSSRLPNDDNSSDNNIFWNSILKFIDNTSNIDLKNKCDKFLDKINYWSILSKTFSINELLSFIYDDSNYYNYLGLLKNGAIRQANLISLIEKSLNFEHMNLNGLFGFIAYIEKIKTFSGDGGVVMTSEGEDVVRIMNIHQSKGLEFPVVFLSNLNRNFNTQDLKKQLIIDELAIGCSVYIESLFDNQDDNDKEIDEDDSVRKQINTIQKNIIKEKIKQENYSENMRLLYVALTRAKEKLILIGCIDKNFHKKNYKKFDDALKFMKDLIINKNDFDNNKFLYNHFIQNSASSNYLGWVYSVIENFDEDKLWDVKTVKSKDILENIPNTTPQDVLDMDKTTTFKNIFEIVSSNNNYNNNAIVENLNWKYKNSIQQKLYSTLSVSEIKEVYNKSFLDTSNKRREKVTELPKFYTNANEELLPSELGTTYHKILENIDFNKSYNNDISEVVNKLVNNNLITQREADAIDDSKIISFLNSSIVSRIKKAIQKDQSKLKREVLFTIGIPACDIYKDIDLKDPQSNNNILVSGIADLYFEEDDEIILVDYKSDKMASESKFIETYKIQLEIYKKALEKATNKKVRECYIYSILNEKAIPVVF
ncbi:MAG: helicase-exonuclease AddAB subunit AddA [bacterium]